MMGKLARFAPVADLDLLAHEKQNTIDVDDRVIADMKALEANGHRCIEVIGKLLHRIHTLQDEHYSAELINKSSFELVAKIEHYFHDSPRELEVLRNLYRATIYPAIDLSATVEAIRATNKELARHARDACPTVVSIASMTTETGAVEIACESPMNAVHEFVEWLADNSVARWYALPIWLEGVIRFTCTSEELRR